MESPDGVVPSRRLPPREHHAHPDWGTLLDGLPCGASVGDEADERLAEGAWESLRDDVGAGGVDGGGRVAVLRPDRRPLEAWREAGLVEGPPLLQPPRELLGRAEVRVHLLRLSAFLISS
uniref:Uncharacterized protein n=1 Tax=Arundo donax TaxID=35708 RepID=A0A0A9FG16_ARUDO